MRTAFIPQMPLWNTPIDEIQFDVFSRHELIPILMALQYLYTLREDVVQKVCRLIGKDLKGDRNPKRGRKGLTEWEVLVLSACRLGCNLDYDALSDLANNHLKIRQMFGLGAMDIKRYPKSTIHDNLTRLSVETINMISNIIVDEGHALCSNALDKVRGDSFVSQRNIHYPTDANLLLDGIRKIIEISAELAGLHNFTRSEWRQHEYLKRKARMCKRRIDKVKRSSGKNRESELKAAYLCFIEHGKNMIDKSLATCHTFNQIQNQLSFQLRERSEVLISDLQHFIAGTEIISELAWRRIVNDEKIPHEEKFFSFFEAGTELINRGKQPFPIEFGHRVLIIQDSAGFIIHSSVMDRGVTDEKVLTQVMKNLQERFNNKIKAASFDKGFWSKINFEELSNLIDLPVLPKKGKRSAEEQQRESSPEFGNIRKWHSGVESVIHSLVAGNGMKVCRDKGSTAYARYLAMAVLGRNLQTLGTILLKKEREKQRKRLKLAA